MDVVGEIKPIQADPFHLENAFSNLLDNAVKYGGNKISLKLHQENKTVLSISDDGGHISPDQKNKVFDKFYRIPKGNIHDVKGFGIGLYYTKKIIEKQGGDISLSIGTNISVFKVELP